MSKIYVYIKSWNQNQATLICNSMKTPKDLKKAEAKFIETYGQPITYKVEVQNKLYSKGHFKYIDYGNRRYHHANEFVNSYLNIKR